MKKIVRLTENDMTRLVRKIVNEQYLINESACESGEHTIDQLKQAAYKTTQGKDATFTATVGGGVNCWYLNVKVGNTNYNILL
jgi:hypothetical protein